ncbi:MAG: DEAD/DEAH box helicase family protein [Firmicutes bacterium]|nr:DEAD/DEAH box helicase family protein [Bacillota bacterium]
MNGGEQKKAGLDKLNLGDLQGRIEEVFMPGGAISQRLEGYEERPGQLLMAKTVARALWEGRAALIEAGTGTGKSLAYLVPASYWTSLSRERVIVSTNTINLQEQLINKDVPFLQSVIDTDLQVAVIKGWSNYLCLYRFQTLGQHGQVSLWTKREEEELAALAEWLTRCKTGSRSEIDFPLSEETWWEICAESDVCLRARCPYIKDCFYFKERKQAFEADIIIVNHHLLFADLAVRQVMGFDTKRSVLPPYRYIILDEAHHVEDVATEHFGLSLSKVGVSRLLGRLQRIKQGRTVGLLHQIQAVLETAPGMQESRAQAALVELTGEVIPELQRSQTACSIFFDRAADLIKGDGGERTAPLWPTPGGIQLWPVLSEESRAFLTSLKDLERVLRSFRDRLSAAEGEKWDIFKAELGALENRISQSRSILEFMSGEPPSDYVYWGELSGRRSEPSLHAAPIEVAEVLRQGVYRNLAAVVLTSATLAIDRRFDHIRRRLGLDGIDIIQDNCLGQPPLEELIASPFDYRRQVLLCIPTDIGEPKYGQYGSDLAEYVKDVLLATSGRAFVLFTSYRLLREVYQYCCEPLAEAGIRALCQGTTARSLLLEHFRKDTRSVLFGTSSFWEGVDVPGEALSCVILTKLPFQVPDHPVVASRIRRLEETGRNPFVEYMVPQAVIRFKQGFGRLIRRTSDHGVIVVCDSRLLGKSYGETFLRSIPECSTTIRPRRETLSSIVQWLTGS